VLLFALLFLLEREDGVLREEEAFGVLLDNFGVDEPDTGVANDMAP